MPVCFSMSRIAPFFAVLFLSFTLSGCLSYKQVELKEIADFEVKKMTSEGVEIDLTAQIVNPNGYKISVTDYDLELFVNGSSLGKPEISEKLVLPRKSDAKHTVTVKASLAGLMSQGLGAMLGLMSSSKIDFAIKGHIKAKAMGVKKTIDVDEAYTYEM